MGQKGRISISQSIALQAPLGIEDQIAEARATARPEIVDIEELIAKSKREEEQRSTLRQLAAPPSAVKALASGKAKREARLRQMQYANARTARPRQIIEKTSAAPTDERMSKQPYGMEQRLEVGGQVQHRPRMFLEVFEHHVRDDLVPALELLRAAWEIVQRVRMTSARTYTGMPYTGVGPDHDGHVPMTPGDRRDLEHFAYAMPHMTENTPEWWDILRQHILGVPPEDTGRLQSVNELGALWTKYRSKSDNATAAGVGSINAALLRWKEAVQAGAMKLQYAKMRRRARAEEEQARYVDERRLRLKGG